MPYATVVNCIVTAGFGLTAMALPDPRHDKPTTLRAFLLIQIPKE